MGVFNANKSGSGYPFTPTSPHLRPGIPRGHRRNDDLHALVVVKEVVAYHEVEEASRGPAGRRRRSDNAVWDRGIRVNLNERQKKKRRRQRRRVGDVCTDGGGDGGGKVCRLNCQCIFGLRGQDTISTKRTRPNSGKNIKEFQALLYRTGGFCREQIPARPPPRYPHAVQPVPCPRRRTPPNL